MDKYRSRWHWWYRYAALFMCLPNAVLWMSSNSWVAHRTTHGGKLGCPNHSWVTQIILTHLKKDISFSVIYTKFACFLFNDVPTYRELGRPSGDLGGHVGSPYQVIGRIWRPVIHSTANVKQISEIPVTSAADQSCLWQTIPRNKDQTAIDMKHLN